MPGNRGPVGPVRIANCSGFYGDRLSAPTELLAGPDAIDVLTGDYLAELTMLILWKAREKDPGAGYARTFLTQMEEVLGTCLERGVRVVTNAGGLNPHGLADRLTALAAASGLDPRVAVVSGDDLSARLGELTDSGEELANLDTGQRLTDAGVVPITANAYLGGWGIAAALKAGADVVVSPRVTDAALTVGPAAWWHRWATDDWDALAGAVAAGHVIECGTQATGGNYPFTDELSGAGLPGFPVAEVAADGSCVITKQPGTGGAVTLGTVTAQLLYEIDGAEYANPDVIARFDTVRLRQQGPDRVEMSGTRGEPAPDRLKVAINYEGGYRNTMTMVLTGLDIEGKAAQAERLLFEVLGGREQFGSVDVELVRCDTTDASTNAAATAQLRVTVMDRDPRLVGRRFSAAVTELALASYAGFFTLTPPSDAHAYGVYWPALVGTDKVHQFLTLPDGTRRAIPHGGSPGALGAAPPLLDGPSPSDPPWHDDAPWHDDGPTRRLPLGVVCGARSGDKGGNANVGLWTWDDEAYRWLSHTLTVERMRQLVPEAQALTIRRCELANLRAVNFVLVGLLGDGVSSSSRLDPQAKGLGEYVRSRLVDLPERLLPVCRPPRKDGG